MKKTISINFIIYAVYYLLGLAVALSNTQISAIGQNIVFGGFILHSVLLFFLGLADGLVARKNVPGSGEGAKLALSAVLIFILGILGNIAGFLVLTTG